MLDNESEKDMKNTALGWLFFICSAFKETFKN